LILDAMACYMLKPPSAVTPISARLLFYYHRLGFEPYHQQICKIFTLEFNIMSAISPKDLGIGRIFWRILRGFNHLIYSILP
jgi:hypothetical protein